MKTASVQDLRSGVSRLLSWVGDGEEVLITRRGVAVARLIPERKGSVGSIDWSQSAAVRRSRGGKRVLSASESLDIIRNASGKW